MKVLLSALLSFFIVKAWPQSRQIDSLNKLINKSTYDTQRINLKIQLFKYIGNNNLDSAIDFGNNLIKQILKINYKEGEAKARLKLAGDYCFTGNYAAAKSNLDTTKEILSHLNDSLVLGDMYSKYAMMYSMQNKFDTSHSLYKKAIDIISLQKDKTMLSGIYQNNAIAYQQQSDYPRALTNYQMALRVSEQLKDEEDEAYIYLNIAITYNSLDDDQQSEQSYLKSIKLAKKLNLKNVLAYAYANIASLYEGMKKYDKQYDFAMKAAVLGNEMGDKGIRASSLSRAAGALAEENKFQDAEKLNRQAMAVADSSNQPYNIYQTYGTMGFILKLQQKYREAIPYFEKAFHSLTESDIYNEEVGNHYADLSECYEKTGNFNKALFAYKTAAKISDSIRGKDNVKKATELSMNYEFETKQQVEKAEQQKKDAVSKTKQTALIVGLVLTFILAVVAFNGFRNKRRSNFLLQQQKEEIQNTLKELKSTQAQLIQSEKMASLGELTAGIAHEIQNPLNFVNNFSEVNKELLEELKEEAGKGNIDEVKAIANDVIDNSEKINHHGKRADAIVKGMLQHSRKSEGVKESTDINALCDEYLRLSYHGMRAKDKNFNVVPIPIGIKTDFDESIDKISIVPQDIGRVLLNLFNNAFYAVNEKLKTADDIYKPVVSIHTKKINNKVEIIVTDNGNGIPQNILDKIFQPFFTTKPTGEGTGLGLSLSYDIITKEHKGSIKVESKEGEGCTFTIHIPLL